MKILVAPDSFKGSLSSPQVAAHIAAGIRRVLPDAHIIEVPVADGGEGTVEALTAGGKGRLQTAVVTGPLGEPVSAKYGMLADGTAVIEMAAASGLPLAAGRLDPLRATTYGTGELIRAALDHGCTRIIIGIGGSATNDGGAGMAQALGISLRDADGRELPVGGEALQRLHTADLSGMDDRLAQTDIMIASDVKNPLCGPEGASYVFAPQKGADADTVKLLDQCLMHYANIVKEAVGKDFSGIPGAGAAGGLGFGLMALLGAKMSSGIDTVLDAAKIEDRMAGCSLVITGEGRIDGQSVFGKVPVGVARRAKLHGLPVLAVAGGIGPGTEAVYAHGIDAIMSIAEGPISLEDAMARGGELLESAAERALRMIQLGGKYGISWE